MIKPKSDISLTAAIIVGILVLLSEIPAQSATPVSNTYDVWGGDYVDYDESYFTNYYSVDHLGWIRLGAGKGSATFYGAYNYYIIAVRKHSCYIDAVQGSDDTYYSHNFATGNVSLETKQNLLGSPDHQYLIMTAGGGIYKYTYGSFIILSNPGTWTSITVHTYQPTYNLSVKKNGIQQGSGTIRADDLTIDCGDTCNHGYESGTIVTLTALPSANSEFSGWSGECTGTDPVCIVTMNKAINVGATFTGPLTIKVLKSNKKAGSGTVTSDVGDIDCGSICKAQCLEGTSIHLTAVPDTDSVFSGWSVPECPDKKPDVSTCTVTMDKLKTVKATFTGPVALTVKKSLKKGITGNITSTPPGIDCGSICKASFRIGTQVTLTATPETDFIFSKWSLPECSGADTTCTITIDKKKTVIATFGKGG